MVAIGITDQCTEKQFNYSGPAIVEKETDNSFLGTAIYYKVTTKKGNTYKISDDDVKPVMTTKKTLKNKIKLSGTNSSMGFGTEIDSMTIYKIIK